MTSRGDNEFILLIVIQNTFHKEDEIFNLSIHATTIYKMFI